MDQEQTQTAADVFGVRLRKLRTAHRWSQQDVADLLASHGVTMAQTTVAKIERGARPTSLDELLALARVFGCTIGELVGPLDDAFGLGPSPVVRQLGDVEGQGEELAAKIEAIEGRMKATVDAVELMRQAIMATQGPAFMEAFRLAATEQGPAFMKAFRLAHPDVEDVEELEGGSDV